MQGSSKEESQGACPRRSGGFHQVRRRRPLAEEGMEEKRGGLGKNPAVPGESAQSRKIRKVRGR
jgi:hypothetical protein